MREGDWPVGFISQQGHSGWDMVTVVWDGSLTRYPNE